MKVEEYNDILVVTLEGKALDAASSKVFRAEIGPLLTNRKKVVFDLGELDFVDSSGLGALLSSLRQLNGQGGDLKLCNLTKPVRALIELVRMNRVFDIFNSREEALAAFGG